VLELSLGLKPNLKDYAFPLPKAYLQHFMVYSKYLQVLSYRIIALDSGVTGLPGLIV